MSFRARVVAAASSLALAGAVVVGLQQPAVADNADINIRWITASNLTVSSGACRKVPLNAGWTVTSDYEVWGADADVFKGSTYMGSAGLDSTTPYYYWCPFLDGVGKFTVGPTDIDYWYDDGYSYGSGYVTDYTSATFYVRNAASGWINHSRAGNYVTLTARSQRYDIYKQGMVKHTQKAVLQVWNGKTWSYKKTLYPNTANATVRLYAPKKLGYRIVSAPTTATNGFTSTTIWR